MSGQCNKASLDHIYEAQKKCAITNEWGVRTIFMLWKYCADWIPLTYKELFRWNVAS